MSGDAMQREKRKAIKKYFERFPRWAGWAIAIGVLFIFFYGLGLVLIFIGIIAIADWAKRPSDSKMDAFIAEDILMAKAKSLQKTLTDESELVGESVVVTGPRVWSTGGAHIHSRQGSDGILRFTPIDVFVLHLTKDQLVSYQCCLDLTTGNCLNEETNEYFYRDVVSVATKTESLTFDSDELGAFQLNNAETFTLTTSGGTFVRVILRDRELIDYLGGGSIPTTEAEKAIRVVRKMLREKKAAE